jgi:hypothetical protein
MYHVFAIDISLAALVVSERGARVCVLGATMRLLYVALAVLAVGCGLTVLRSPGSVPLRAQQPSPTSTATHQHSAGTITAGPRITGAVIPTITADDRQRAQSLFVTDPRVATILGSRQWVVREIGVWHAGSEKLGVSMIITFPEPISGTFDLPDRTYSSQDRSGSGVGPYQEVSYRATVTNLQEVMVSVNLTSGRVVSVRPSKYTNVALVGTPAAAPAGSLPGPR